MSKYVSMCGWRGGTGRQQSPYRNAASGAFTLENCILPTLRIIGRGGAVAKKKHMLSVRVWIWIGCYYLLPRSDLNKLYSICIQTYLCTCNMYIGKKMQYIYFLIMYTKLYIRLNKASALSSLGGMLVAVGGSGRTPICEWIRKDSMRTYIYICIFNRY